MFDSHWIWDIYASTGSSSKNQESKKSLPKDPVYKYQLVWNHISKTWILVAIPKPKQGNVTAKGHLHTYTHTCTQTHTPRIHAHKHTYIWDLRKCTSLGNTYRKCKTNKHLFLSLTSHRLVASYPLIFSGTANLHSLWVYLFAKTDLQLQAQYPRHGHGSPNDMRRAILTLRLLMRDSRWLGSRGCFPLSACVGNGRPFAGLVLLLLRAVS